MKQDLSNKTISTMFFNISKNATARVIKNENEQKEKENKIYGVCRKWIMYLISENH